MQGGATGNVPRRETGLAVLPCHVTFKEVPKWINLKQELT